MDELMQTAGRYIGRFWTDIAGAGESEEVADVARALVFTPLKALGKRAREITEGAMLSGLLARLHPDSFENVQGLLARERR